MVLRVPKDCDSAISFQRAGIIVSVQAILSFACVLVVFKSRNFIASRNSDPHFERAKYEMKTSGWPEGLRI